VDSASIRCSALRQKVFCSTTLAGAEALVEALGSCDVATVHNLQELHALI